jgi:hypothetical protein
MVPTEAKWHFGRSVKARSPRLRGPSSFYQHAKFLMYVLWVAFDLAEGWQSAPRRGFPGTARNVPLTAPGSTKHFSNGKNRT